MGEITFDENGVAHIGYKDGLIIRYDLRTPVEWRLDAIINKMDKIIELLERDKK